MSAVDLPSVIHHVSGGGSVTSPLHPSQQSVFSSKAWTTDKITPTVETLKFTIPSSVKLTELDQAVAGSSERSPELGAHAQLFEHTVKQLQRLPSPTLDELHKMLAKDMPFDAHSNKLINSAFKVVKHDNGTSSVSMRVHRITNESLGEHYNRLRAAGVPDAVNAVRTAAMASNQAMRHMAGIVMRNPAMSTIVGLTGLGIIASSSTNESHRRHRHHHRSVDN